jgi:hypothetical protein
MKSLKSILKLWLPLVVAFTLICGIVYLVVQQNYRHSANDPQFQMAEDAANSISNGIAPKSLIVNHPIELSSSLSPYLIIYDDLELPIASGAFLNGKIPKLPSGVLEFVKKHGEDMITWQPRTGIRQALIIEKTTSGSLYFVVAGRSLRKTEERIGLLMQQIVLGWVCSLMILFIVICGLKGFTKSEEIT